MAEYAPDDDDKPDATKKQKEAWAEVHKLALEEYERGYLKEQSNIDDAYEDLRFRRGRKEDQWDAAALATRKNRPCHVVNKLPQFIRQVTGDMRRKRPGIKVVPVDSGADIETADVRGGMIRYVENRSKAKHVYTTGADSQVTCGIGHWQVTTEYAHAGTFNQEIRISGIEDGVAVVWDADATLPTKEDADHCFVPIDISLAAFKRRWPNAQASSFDQREGSLGSFTNWSSDNHVRVAAYWKKKPTKRTLALLPDGSIEDLTDQVKDVPKDRIEEGLNFLRAQKQARIEVRDSYTICRYLMSQAEVLEESDWPGMHIPVIPVIGEEVRVGRDVYRHGIVRYARDLQRMENYYASAETEVIALQPKAPWIGTTNQFKQHYDLWETANTENHPFLEYTPDPGAPGPPQRVQPPVASQAIIDGKFRNSEDMKAVIGIYDSALGAKSNETSGVAIARRDDQSDTGTFVYHDNFALAIERTAEIVNELIPKIYDTQRTMRILGDDGKPDMVEINKPLIEGGIEKIQHDMSSGSYDVMMEAGPSYTTKREESKDGMTAFIQALPQAAGVVGDMYAKVMDFPDSEGFGERLEYLMPPELRAKLQADRQKRDHANGKPPSPETQQQAAEQQQQQQMAEKAQQMQFAEAEAKVIEAQAKAETAKQNARKAKADADKAETEAATAKAENANTYMEHLRTIEAHDHEMARGHVDHHQKTQHAQDAHEIDITLKGFGERRAQEQHAQGAEKHKETIKQMQAPKPEMASAAE